MTTIIDVGKEANVSPSTVSRVLNNRGVISPQTVERVHKAAKKLAYEPNVLARSFRKKESRIILVLTPNMTNPYYSNIITGISDWTRQSSYSSFFCNTNGERTQVEDTLSMLDKHRADGAIFLAADKDADWMMSYVRNYPVVFCSEYSPCLQKPHVSIDNYAATVEAIEFLLKLGHRRIATISSRNQYLSTEMRLKAYRDTLTGVGIRVSDAYIKYADADYSYRSGCEVAKALLEQKPRPTAVFCISDILGIAMVNTAKEAGFSVPDDLSIIGFDDVEEAEMINPRITTIAQPCYDLGRRSAEMLITLLNGELADMELLLPHKLIVRTSTAVAPDLA